MLARTARAIRVFGETRREGCVARRDELGVACELFLVEDAALFDVGLDEELAPVAQKARDLVHETRSDNQALFVLFLPPGIREMQIHDVDRSVGAKPHQDLARVAVHDPSALTEA